MSNTNNGVTPMDKLKLDLVLKKHALWLSGDGEGERANLEGANLSYANLEGVNLEGANLSYANLEDVNLEGVNLRGVNLEDTNLSYAHLGGANLEDTNLRGANLGGANLGGTNLEGVNLEDANLRGANLGGANLEDANLSYANLEDVNLEGVNLSYVNLGGVRGNNRQIKSLHIAFYDVAYTTEHIQIGCEKHTHKEWAEFTDKEILGLDGKQALTFWRKYKEYIFQTIELSPAVEG